jgi:PAS domain S-box-containing protein
MPEKTILIAEDSPTQSEQLCHLLSSEGYRAISRESGDEAFEEAKKILPDMILSDIIMPGITGYDFCRKAKAEPTLKSIPFILLTSMNHSTDILKGLECGADNYITKPIDNTHLLKIIHNSFESSNQFGTSSGSDSFDFHYSDEKYRISPDRTRILNMFLTTYEESAIKAHKLDKTQRRLGELKDSLEKEVVDATRDLIKEIKDRTRIAKEAALSEERYRNQIENPLFGVFSVSSNGQFIVLNHTLSSMLGYDSPELLMEKKIEEIFYSKKDFKEFQQLLKKEQTIKNIEVSFKGIMGNRVHVMINAQIRDETILCMALDISQEKLLREKEIQNQKELEIAKINAEESDRLKSAFLSGLSHEVRTPLNTIIGFSGLLADPEISEETRKEFSILINDSCIELHRLIENILEISKLDAGQVIIEPRDFDLHQLLDDIFQTYNREWNLGRKGRIRFRLLKPDQDKIFSIRSDPFSIYKVFSKLLDNSFKFTPAGSIEFGYEIPDPETLRFFIRDTGIGMTEKQIRLAFGSFNKADQTDPKLQHGAGLGLAICLKTVELLKGEIWVESSPGRGSTFYFKVPLHMGPAGKTKISLPVSVDKPLNWKEKRILVAEDNFYNYKLYEAILSKTDARLTWAKDGLEAFEKCKSNNSYNLILMDIQMPRMNGIEATESIRSLGDKVPIIAITAFASDEDRQRIMKGGFNDFLSKPVSPDTLLKTLGKYISDAKN